MRRLLLLAPLALVVAACTDATSPTNPLEDAPTVQATHLTGTDFVQDELCAGRSPCDAFDYDREPLDGVPDGLTGVPGFCFLQRGAAGDGCRPGQRNGVRCGYRHRFGGIAAGTGGGGTGGAG